MGWLDAVADYFGSGSGGDAVTADDADYWNAGNDTAGSAPSTSSGGINWGQYVTPAINAGTRIYGARQVADANNQAAQISNNAAQQQIDLARQAQEYTQPGMAYLRTLTTMPSTQLTPQQKIAQEDMRRAAIAQATKSGLAGSGRTVAAIVNDVDNRFVADAQRTNQGRSDLAAHTLAGQNPALTNDISNAIGTNAVNQGNSVTNTAKVDASTLGAIGSIFANANKDEGRKSAYEKSVSGTY